jgi:predicted amino acid racemase
MKKSLRKVIVTLSAVAALSLAMGATAMAAESGVTVTDGNAVFTYSTTATPGEEVTVLLLKPGAVETDGIDATEIAYIDQKTADATTGAVEFTMPVAGVAEGTSYALKSGSASAETPATDAIVIPSADADVHYGDVLVDNAIDVFDALEILKYASYMDSVFDADESLLAAGDVTGDEAVDVFDALPVLQYASYMETEYDEKFAWADAE